MEGVEWTACHFGTTKLAHAIFGTLTGRIYNFKYIRNLARIELASKREMPLLQTKDSGFTCRVNQIVALKDKAGTYAIATDHGVCVVFIDTNEIIVSMSRSWFIERDIQCICEAGDS